MFFGCRMTITTPEELAGDSARYSWIGVAASDHDKAENTRLYVYTYTYIFFYICFGSDVWHQNLARLAELRQLQAKHFKHSFFLSHLYT